MSQSHGLLDGHLIVILEIKTSRTGRLQGVSSPSVMQTNVMLRQGFNMKDSFQRNIYFPTDGAEL